MSMTMDEGEDAETERRRTTLRRREAWSDQDCPSLRWTRRWLAVRNRLGNRYDSVGHRPVEDGSAREMSTWASTGKRASHSA
jgi:hypothetical protein